MARRASRGLAGLTLLALAGCNWYYNTLPSPDDLMKLVPWFDHMITSPRVSPYSSDSVPRNTVPGTVPITGGEPDWGTGNPAQLVYAFDTLAANALVNPVPPTRLAARGDTLYHNFCAACHGSTGAGDGLVGKRMGALSLLTDKAKAYTDGYLYSIIRYGRGVMPQYGDKIFRFDERWAVVNYVRRLQGGAPAAQGAAQ